MDASVGELLRKFGSGNHKPGSGSAAALDGMLAAQLLFTVIDLTNEPRRRASYADHLHRLGGIRAEIESRIFPRLEALFQEDSEQFDRVIEARNKRDGERNPSKKRAEADRAMLLLKAATELPLEIAELCLEIVEFGEQVFDLGFQSARGDAGVALNDALAGVIGCLSIIELNLLSLPLDDWMVRTLERKSAVRTRYNAVSSKGEEKLKVLESEVEELQQMQRVMAKYLPGNLTSPFLQKRS